VVVVMWGGCLFVFLSAPLYPYGSGSRAEFIASHHPNTLPTRVQVSPPPPPPCAVPQGRRAALLLGARLGRRGAPRLRERTPGRDRLLVLLLLADLPHGRPAPTIVRGGEA
jgi:hypothetical protein